MQYFIRNGYLIVFYQNVNHHCFPNAKGHYFHIVNLKTRDQYLSQYSVFEDCTNYTVNGNVLSLDNFKQLMLNGKITDVTVNVTIKEICGKVIAQTFVSLNVSMTCGCFNFNVDFSNIPMVNDSRTNAIYDCKNSTFIIIFGSPYVFEENEESICAVCEQLHMLYVVDEYDDEDMYRDTYISKVVQPTNTSSYSFDVADGDYVYLRWTTLFSILDSMKFKRGDMLVTINGSFDGCSCNIVNKRTQNVELYSKYRLLQTITVRGVKKRCHFTNWVDDIDMHLLKDVNI